jgi:hypothetical protein
MAKKWTLQHTGYPVAGQPIYDGEWKDLSYHSTVRAAFRRITKERSHLDCNSWDDHFRVLDPDRNLVNMNALEAEIAAEKYM